MQPILCLFKSCTASWTVASSCSVTTFRIMSFSTFKVEHPALAMWIFSGAEKRVMDFNYYFCVKCQKTELGAARKSLGS